MTRKLKILVGVLLGALAAVVRAEDPIPSPEELHDRAVANWPAPLLWSPRTSQPSNGEALEKSATPTSPLIFVGISPCRLADTRDSTKPPGYGPPALSAGVPRNFTVAGHCGIAPEAAAVSLNLTVVDPLGPGYILVFPQGGPFAGVSTLNYAAAQTVANAAIVPVGNSGGITLDAGVSGTELIIDVNGYYANNLTSQGGLFSLTTDSPASALYVTNTDATGIGSGGGFFVTDSCGGGSAGVSGLASSTSSCGSTFGVSGETLSPAVGSAGVFGTAGGTSSGTTFGVLGTTASVSNTAAGVKGVGGYGDTPYCGTCFPAGVVGTNAGSPGTGVVGISPDIGTSGVLQDNSGNTVAVGYLGLSGPYGVFSGGDFGGTGAKYFVEPHPKDASKVIRYVALEGPEAGTYFRGTSETHGGSAVIDVPETFRLVTEQEGLTVQLTPIGEFAMLVVVSEDLNRIVIQSSKDVRFHYQVNGVRHGYAGFDPVSSGSVFAPRNAIEKLPAYLTDPEKRALIANGTFNADGSVNLETARALAWDRAWPTPQK